MIKRFSILSLFIFLYAASQSFAQGDNGMYTPAYSNPYSSPLSSATNTGAAGMRGGGSPMATPGNGNGNDKDKDKKNGVPLDTEAWALMIAGAAFGAWTVLKGKRNIMLKLYSQQ